MTGGAGEDSGGEAPDDNYLRLDAANNPASPNNFLRTTDANLLYVSLANGGRVTGNVTFTTWLDFDIAGMTSGLMRMQEWFGGIAFRNVQNAVNFIVMGGTDTDNPYLYLTGSGVNINRSVRITGGVTFKDPADLEQKIDNHYTSGNSQNSPWIVISGNPPTGDNVGPGCVWFELP